MSQPAKGEAGGSERGHKRKKAAKARKKKRAKIQEPPAVIDPDLALVIKRPIRVQIIAMAHQRAISPVEFAEGYGYH